MNCEIIMAMANESGLMFASDEDSKADRKLFVHNLGVLLSQTREDIVCAELDDDEIVTITFIGGHTVLVNVNMDSYLAIIRDVVKRI